MRLPPLLVLRARDRHDVPDLLLAVEMTAEHRQELLEINEIRRGSSGATIHLNARRVHHEVVNTQPGEIPVDPESVPSGLVTARDRRIGR